MDMNTTPFQHKIKCSSPETVFIVKNNNICNV